MPQVQSTFAYRAFGLTIDSEIPLPELTTISDSGMTPDAVILIDDITHLNFDATAGPFDIGGSVGIITFRIPNTALFSVENGTTIKVFPLSGADWDMIGLFILGSCMGALLLQRGILPLHGSAVVVDGKAYAFVGDSGAGKSTLAAAFMAKGYHLASDDVIALDLTVPQDSPIVIPSYPQQKLWQQSLDGLGISGDCLQSIYGRLDKYRVPVRERFHAESLPLAGVIELSNPSGENIEIKRVSSLERIDALYRHTYRNFLVARLDMTEWHFHRLAMIASTVSIYRLHRPAVGFSAPELVSALLNTFAKEN